MDKVSAFRKDTERVCSTLTVSLCLVRERMKSVLRATFKECGIRCKDVLKMSS